MKATSLIRQYRGQLIACKCRLPDMLVESCRFLKRPAFVSLRIQDTDRLAVFANTQPYWRCKIAVPRNKHGTVKQIVRSIDKHMRGDIYIRTLFFRLDNIYEWTLSDNLVCLVHLDNMRKISSIHKLNTKRHQRT